MRMDRRSRRAMREMTEAILHRASALEPEERAVVEHVIGRGVSASQLAALTGSNTRAVQRRVRRLVDRLLDPEVVYILRHRADWEPARAAVATALWVHGMTLRGAAEKLAMNLQQVRDHAQAVRGLVSEGYRMFQRRRQQRERRLEKIALAHNEAA